MNKRVRAYSTPIVDVVAADHGLVAAQLAPPFLLTAAVLSSAFLVMLDNTAINLALPQIQHDLAANLSELEWAVNAYVLSFASLMLAAAGVVARRGARRVFTAGLALFGLASVGCGLASDPHALIVAGALQGAGAALLVPAGLSLILEGSMRRGVEPPALWSLVVAAGLAAGPVVGGALTSFFGWRAIFLVNAPIVVVCLLVVRFDSAPASPSPVKPSDPLSVALSGLAVFALTFTVIDMPRSGSVPVLASLIVFAGAGSWFVSRQRRSPSVVDLSLLRKPAFAAAAVGSFVVGFALFGTMLFVSILEQSLGRSPVMAGLMFVPLTAAMVVAAPLLSRVQKYHSVTAPRLAIGGLLVFALGLAVLSQTCDGLEVGAMTTAFVVTGIGVALTADSLTRLAIGAAPREASDAAAALVGTVRQLGGALGISVMGLIVQATAAKSHGSVMITSGSYGVAVSTALMVAAGVVLIGAIVVALLRRATVRVAT